MRIFNPLITASILLCTFSNYAQTKDKTDLNETAAEKASKENSSQETVTKIIRIKGANGEEKVIKQQQVITKKSELKLNPEDESNTNQSAIYAPTEVSVQDSKTTSNEKLYSSIPEKNGFFLTFIDETGERTAKAKLLSNGYYIVNSGPKDNCLGHFDENKNLTLELYNSKDDTITTLIYKLK